MGWLVKLIIRPFRLQKAGNTFEECEDQSFHAFMNSGQDAYELSDQNLSVVGVADGATEGILSGKWAEILNELPRSKLRGIKNSEQLHL